MSTASVTLDDQRMLIMAVGDLKAGIQSVDGKVDTAVALLREQAARQDRAELRVESVERDLDHVRESIRTEIGAFKEKTEDRFQAVNWRIAMGVGGISVLAILIPIVAKLAFGF